MVYARALLRSIPASAGETLSRRWRRRAAPVHPRECGGNTVTITGAPTTSGPSPRVRGKRFRRRSGLVGIRSIPASAGETGALPAIPRSRRVHPRECGGNVLPSGGFRRLTGPSPRVRGKRHVFRSCITRPGSIPASAGETRFIRIALQHVRVHPRECGGNPPAGREILAVKGPSPRVRGKLGQLRSIANTGRSIPASAGETPL